MDKRTRASTFVFVLLFVASSVLTAVPQSQFPSASPLSPAEIAKLEARAQAGDPDAQLKLGEAYDDGNGVSQSDREAVKWYRAAAEQGNASGQANLGLMIRLGRGVEQNKEEAVKWYRKAAKQKNALAMFNLGTAYFNGDGTSIDDVAAYAWFSLAQEHGSKTGGDAVTRMNQEARQFQTAAYEKIGDMYLKGDDLTQSNESAVTWYRKAAGRGDDASVQIKLANLLLKTQGGSDYKEVHRLCEKAANLRYSPGAYCMGLLYQRGWAVQRDLSQAAKWFEEAANLGHVFSMLQLGQMYWNGEGVKQDRISAYKFAYLAATSELPEAKQQKERFEKEMNPKEIGKGKAKAIEWSHYHHGLVLIRR